MNKNYIDIMKAFFECYNHNNCLSDDIVEYDQSYLSDSGFNKEDSDSD